MRWFNWLFWWRSANILLGPVSPAPSSRTFTVAFETRAFDVAAESRAFTVAFENRTFTV